eukprot:gene15056-21133_t
MVVDRDDLMAGLRRHDEMDEDSSKDDKDDKSPKE